MAVIIIPKQFKMHLVDDIFKVFDVLSVASPNVTITPLMNLTLRLGMGFYLTCTASGFSTPRILWYHNRTLLNETERDNFEILSINDDTTYSVTSYLNATMTMTRDSGVYNCMAVTGIPDHDAADSDVVTVIIQS